MSLRFKRHIKLILMLALLTALLTMGVGDLRVTAHHATDSTQAAAQAMEVGSRLANLIDQLAAAAQSLLLRVTLHG